jgi:DUF177 domain-containing protein
VFLDLEKLPAEGEAIDLGVPGGGLSTDGEEFRLSSDVEIKGRIQRVDSDETGAYRLEGSIACRIELPCVRCLEPFQMDVHELLDLLYLPQPAPKLAGAAFAHAAIGAREARPARAPGRQERAKGAKAGPGSRHEDGLEERSLEADELAASFYEDDRIDLGQMILEQIVLALPMKPLCKVDCRGLCPECGANRNATSCDCEIDDTDPRWATLKTLLGR